MYIYESHMGGLFTSEGEYDEDQLYCETCGDWDVLVGEASSYAEAWAWLRPQTSIEGRGGYEVGYIKRFLAENFEIPKEQTVTNREALKYYYDEDFSGLSDKELALHLLELEPVQDGDFITTADGREFEKRKEYVKAEIAWFKEDFYQPLKEAWLWHDHVTEEDELKDKPNGRLELQ